MKSVNENFNVKEYHGILCNDYPDFLEEYASLPVMQRLGGVGLLCGTDWTPLFNNRFFYTRLDHSIGAALIVWNFTHDKKQTLAALFHDIATPAFSHVTDFRNGDALKQESTERLTAEIINENALLKALLLKQGIYNHEVDDYHKYPIADNEIPGLSADRLEYMYPSGAALCGEWSVPEIRDNYGNICVLENERGEPELGFADLEAAVIYLKKFCNISMLLQRNEDKIAMQLLADILSCAIKCGYADEADFFNLPEKELIARFDVCARMNSESEFARLFKTFRSMKKIERTNVPIENAFCVNLEVKKRYVDPLVKLSDGKCQRASSLSQEASECILGFVNFKDSDFGCVRFV